MIIDFISIIISKEENLEFYKAIGFVEIDREYRPDIHDLLVWMKGNGLTLKIFVDSTHPKESQIRKLMVLDIYLSKYTE